MMLPVSVRRGKRVKEELLKLFYEAEQHVMVCRLAENGGMMIRWLAWLPGSCAFQPGVTSNCSESVKSLKLDLHTLNKTRKTHLLGQLSVFG